jgi:fructan beta-fructosidase
MTDPTVPRPTFHFTPRRNWMNDPNGLVHHRGVWHLFFQYNPDGPDWGNMSWGHATSVDFETWTEQPIACQGTATGPFGGSPRSETGRLGGQRSERRLPGEQPHSR